MGSYAGSTAMSDDLHEDQLPPLYAALAIDGLPPFHKTVPLDEAEAGLAKIAARWITPSFDDYCRLSLFTASVAHSKVISTNCLVDISLQYCLVFSLDDLRSSGRLQHLSQRTREFRKHSSMPRQGSKVQKAQKLPPT